MLTKNNGKFDASAGMPACVRPKASMARGIAGPVGSLACNAERRDCVLECEGEIDGPVLFAAAVRLRTRRARYGWKDVSHVSVLNNVGRD